MSIEHSKYRCTPVDSVDILILFRKSVNYNVDILMLIFSNKA